jgi:hypothetical protein
MDPFLIFDNCNLQIGQCRITIDLRKTKEFYSTLPKITENCNCGDCERFEKDIINRPSRLFDILTSMQVDLSRQPNINTDGISCIGEVRENKVGYLGNYFVYGHFGKTSKKTAILNAEGNIDQVAFSNSEFGANNQVTFKRIDNDKISVEFYIEVEIK